MGVIAPSSPLPVGSTGALVPAGSAARSTVEGYDPKIHDKFFEAVNTELGVPFWLYNRVPVLRQTCRHAQPVMTQSAMFACGDGSYVYYTLILADHMGWMA